MSDVFRFIVVMSEQL